MTRPAVLASLEELVRSVDTFVMINPEYNHCMCPTLTDLLNCIPGSAFAFKPSLIATYSGELNLPLPKMNVCMGVNEVDWPRTSSMG